MSQISVVIVSWNACGHLRECLASIRKTGGALVREVIVVDNASGDGSPEMVREQFPEVLLIRADQNLGFSRANNLGIARATGSLIALVNSDVVVHPECFQRLTQTMDERPDVGLCGPKVFGRDALLQRTCGQLPTLWNTLCRLLGLDRSRWALFSGFQMRHWNYDSLRDVEVLSGCFWLARRSCIDAVGGLDERFFFYSEDVDWCKRCNDAGWKVLFVPAATATHYGGGSSSNAPLRYSIQMLRGNLAYWKKHHGYFGYVAFYLLVSLRCCLRFTGLSLLRVVDRAADVESGGKLQEDRVCLRWLLTGQEGR